MPIGHAAVVDQQNGMRLLAPGRILVNRSAANGESYLLATVVNAFTVTAFPNLDGVVLLSAGNLAAGTLTLPANPLFSRRIFIVSNFAVTTLTLSALPGVGLIRSSVSLVAGVRMILFYEPATDTWF